VQQQVWPGFFRWVLKGAAVVVAASDGGHSGRDVRMSSSAGELWNFFLCGAICDEALMRYWVALSFL
jgi:hypothetical protein